MIHVLLDAVLLDAQVFAALLVAVVATLISSLLLGATADVSQPFWSVGYGNLSHSLLGNYSVFAFQEWIFWIPFISGS